MDPTTRFTTRAEDYAAARPSYPPAIVSAVLTGFRNPVVADLGAGTGISARVLAAAGATVLAVEPNAKMRAHIAASPAITPIDGSAEATTLPAASVDIVTAFQAFHWFDRVATVREVERIARRRARFAGVWNHRDIADPFMQAFNAVIDRYSEENELLERARHGSRVLDAFEDSGWQDTRIVRVENVQMMTWEVFVAFLRSVSYLPQSGLEHDTMVRDVYELFEERERDGRIPFRWLAEAHLAERQ
jgi:SAM-dependent methyltransferase